MKIYPVILSGGSGTRLWPLSRRAYPKQFHNLTGDMSLLQQTVKRLEDDLYEAPTLLGNHEHRFLMAEQLLEMGIAPHAIVLEPQARNTAPAAVIAALMMACEDKDALVLLLPSDHVVQDKQGFAQSVRAGMDAAARGDIVTFGVRPDAPETGYGYIEASGEGEVLDVARFVEKPDRATAQRYLDDGRYYWNAGIFLFHAQAMIETFARFAPDILSACEKALERAKTDLDFLRLDNEAFAAAPGISFDYAIMEKAENIKCVPLATTWSDLGAWPAVWQHLEKDNQGNAVLGDVMLHDTRNSYAQSSDGKCLALVGLDDVMVVATTDAILVAARDSAQDVKAIPERLKKENRPEAVYHSRVYRPWGWYEGLVRGERFQVKCLSVKPGGRLSLQSHFHRAEHWVVVSGTAEVTVGEKTMLLSENESTYIPIGTVHRLTNPGKLPALLVEVQSGSYLGEDDIVRYEDVYGREADAKTG